MHYLIKQWNSRHYSTKLHLIRADHFRASRLNYYSAIMEFKIFDITSGRRISFFHIKQISIFSCTYHRLPLQQNKWPQLGLKLSFFIYELAWWLALCIDRFGQYYAYGWRYRWQSSPMVDNNFDNQSWYNTAFEWMPSTT